jgi:hypothetical protein
LLEADFGLDSGRPAHTRPYIAAEQRVSTQGVLDLKIDLDQEDKVEKVSARKVSPTNAKQHIERARRAAVTFEFVLILGFLVWFADGLWCPSTVSLLRRTGRTLMLDSQKGSILHWSTASS